MAEKNESLSAPTVWSRRSFLKSTAGAAVGSSLVRPAGAAQRALWPFPVRERSNFNTGWRFHLGDSPDVNGELNYVAIRQWLLPSGNAFSKTTSYQQPGGNLGGNVQFVQSGFDDSGWRSLDLPHDWGIEQLFDQSLPSSAGKLEWWGVAWYRKHFRLLDKDAGKRIVLGIDGAMSYAAFWLNGNFVGGWPYGYASFELDLTPYINIHGDNVLAVRLDNPPESSRWYPGAGIYRNTWLTKTSPVYVGQWGTFIRTTVANSKNAQLEIEVDIVNETNHAQKVTIQTYMFGFNLFVEPFGYSVPLDVTLGPREMVTCFTNAALPSPQLWSPDQPNRYTAVTFVTQGGQLLDDYTTLFGVRTIAFNANNGFLLNGHRLQLRGVCLHDDLGAIGTALNYSALKRRLGIMKEMGCNAIRTSHNPHAPELLDLSDELGFVVMDEAFDTWDTPKMKNDYNLLWPDWHEQDLRALIRRDRNHPSVILWNIGNEIPDQTSSQGPMLAKELVEIVHDEDPTRPAISNCDNPDSAFNSFGDQLDVFGYSYNQDQYPNYHAQRPNKPFMGSETSSCISTRGYYVFPVSDGENRFAGSIGRFVYHIFPLDSNEGVGDNQISSYDLYAPPWACAPDTEFEALDKTPQAAGEFAWAGFDYLGEPIPYGDEASPTSPLYQAPSRSCYFGIVDLAGLKKDRFYSYQARWCADLPMVHILPHWDWPERVGQVTPVHVYTSGDSAQLFVNGRSKGKLTKQKYQYRLRWDDVVYQPGKLQVVAYKNGRPWAEKVVRTSGGAFRLVLKPERTVIQGDGMDLVYFVVSAVDAKGNFVPRANNLVQFTVNGPGEIVATDNGDPTDQNSFQNSKRHLFFGEAVTIIRSKSRIPGLITVTARASGLAQGTAAILGTSFFPFP